MKRKEKVSCTSYFFTTFSFIILDLEDVKLVAKALLENANEIISYQNVKIAQSEEEIICATSMVRALELKYRSQAKEIVKLSEQVKNGPGMPFSIKDDSKQLINIYNTLPSQNTPNHQNQCFCSSYQMNSTFS
jgi:hypothetical protein